MCLITAEVTSSVLSPPPRSGVVTPSFKDLSMASSIILAFSGKPNHSSILAALFMAPIGLAMPFPAMSRADPWMGSNKAYLSPRLALATKAEASQDSCSLVAQDITK